MLALFVRLEAEEHDLQNTQGCLRSLEDEIFTWKLWTEASTLFFGSFFALLFASVCSTGGNRAWVSWGGVLLGSAEELWARCRHTETISRNTSSFPEVD